MMGNTPEAIEAAEALLRLCRSRMHTEMLNGHVYGRTKEETLLVHPDGSVTVSRLRNGRTSTVRSAPGGSLRVAFASGDFKADRTGQSPSQMLHFANAYLGAACGPVVLSVKTNGLIASLQRDGAMKVWSLRDGAYLAISKPAGSCDIAADFIVPIHTWTPPLAA